MSISYNSIGQVCITCYNNGAQVNQPCKMNANNGVSACQDTDAIAGVVVAARGNLATVAVKGFVTVSYSGDAPALGFSPIAATGMGKVKQLEGAHEYLVVSVDTAKKTVTFCL
ncbi:MAG: hypothetical protein IJG45_07960 [Oscillospiraceae bacterium]|nr:hypothetical protein [Oscillospiraceae bacterium]